MISQVSGAANPPTPTKDWTVLVYAGGVNNLDSYLCKNIEELAHTPMAGNVDVVVRHIDQKGLKTDQHLEPDGFHLLGASQGAPVNSAEPAQLAEFLQLGIRKYPAHHYLVIVSSHGRGAQGVVEDELHKATISPQGFSQALEAARQVNGGRPVDGVFFDACRMMAVEMLSEMGGVAEVVVGSIDRVAGEGYGYAEIVTRAAASVDAHDLGERLVALQGPRQVKACNSLSAVDLQRLRPLTEALAEFSHQLAGLDPDSARRVRQISLESRRSTPSPSFMEGLEHMADYILNSYPQSKEELKDWLEMTTPGDPVSILSLCQGMLNDQGLMREQPELRKATEAVAAAHDQAVFSEPGQRPATSGGLTIMLPLQRTQPLESQTPRFADATGWNRALETIVPLGVAAPPRHTWLERGTRFDLETLTGKGGRRCQGFA